MTTTPAGRVGALMTLSVLAIPPVCPAGAPPTSRREPLAYANGTGVIVSAVCMTTRPAERRPGPVITVPAPRTTLPAPMKQPLPVRTGRRSIRSEPGVLCSVTASPLLWAKTSARTPMGALLSRPRPAHPPRTRPPGTERRRARTPSRGAPTCPRPVAPSGTIRHGTSTGACRTPSDGPGTWARMPSPSTTRLGPSVDRSRGRNEGAGDLVDVVAGAAEAPTGGDPVGGKQAPGR